jgi:molybdate transport system regulatory protein
LDEIRKINDTSIHASRQFHDLPTSTTSRLSWDRGQKNGRPFARPVRWLQGIGQSLHSNASMKTKPARAPRLFPRLRVLVGDDIALGPGKVDLLALIGETGSIREAAERMGMSYMRAWTLVKTMNACFREPLVVASRGGKERGGAALTETGRRALKLYQGLEAKSLKACADTWRQLCQLLTD